ncbi:MAG: hypothetical protein ACJ74O_13310 [Frankiaceae bacterium]
MTAHRQHGTALRRRVVPTAVAAAVTLMAGCGAGTPTSTRQAASKVTARDVSAVDNRDRAEREATRLLGLATLPPGAVRQETPPQRLRDPFQRPAVTSLIDRSSYWRVTMPFGPALVWMRAHPPAGLRHGGSGHGVGYGYRLAGDTYAAPSRPGIQRPQLTVELASMPGGTTAIRIDALAIWLDPSPVRDRVRGPRLRITVAGGCPASSTGRVGVQSSGDDLADALLPPGRPSAALMCRYSGLNDHPALHLVTERRLDVPTTVEIVRQARQLDLSHSTGGSTMCPAGFGDAIALALSYSDRPDVDLWYEPTGCPVISNGVIRAGAGSLGDALQVAAGLPR